MAHLINLIIFLASLYFLLFVGNVGNILHEWIFFQFIYRNLPRTRFDIKVFYHPVHLGIKFPTIKG